MPFTVEQFFDVFQSYNQAIFPAQVVAYLLGLAAVYLALRGASRTVAVILGAFWLWMGVAYHIVSFSAINRAAYGFGALFVVQALLFLLPLRSRLTFRPAMDAFGVVGGLFIAYGLVIYPLLGLLFGHAYPRAPMFGVAPCPTVIFTFGLMLWTVRPVPRYAVIIPLLWSLLGASAAISLNVPQDYGLLVAGVVGSAMLLVREATGPRRVARPV